MLNKHSFFWFAENTPRHILMRNGWWDATAIVRWCDDALAHVRFVKLFSCTSFPDEWNKSRWNSHQENCRIFTCKIKYNISFSEDFHNIFIHLYMKWVARVKLRDDHIFRRIPSIPVQWNKLVHLFDRLFRTYNGSHANMPVHKTKPETNDKHIKMSLSRNARATFISILKIGTIRFSF